MTEDNQQLGTTHGDEKVTGPKPGDLCRILSGGLVEHVAPCHQAGQVTDVRDGRVLSTWEAQRAVRKSR